MPPPKPLPLWRRPFGVALLALLLLLPSAPFGVPGGVGGAGALAWLDGRLPYGGFWTMYAPGHFGLLAGLFALFGRATLVGTVAALLLLAGACGVLTRLLLRLRVAPSLAAAAALLFAASQWRLAATLTSWHPALLLLAVAFERLLAALQDGRARDGWLAGLCFGAAAWSKHDVAAYGCAAALLGTLLCAGGAAARATALRVASGAALVAGAGVAAVASMGGSAAWEALVRFPLTEFALSRPERYPTLLAALDAARGPQQQLEAIGRWLTHHAPLWIAIAALLVAWIERRRLAAAQRAALLAAAAAAFAFFAAAHVQINTHLATLTALSLTLLAAAGSAARRAGGAARGGLALFALAYVAALAIEPARAAVRALDLARHGAWVDAPGATLLRAPARDAAALSALARRIDELAAPGEPLFIGLHRHDVLLTSAPWLHLLLQRPQATRYAELHPAIADRAAAQQEIVADLDHVRVVVLWHVGWPAERFAELRERRAALLPGSGATLLDERLARDFAPAGRYGEYEVRVRR
ncbi:MAG: hypothetical protein JNL90_08045 [Planctomycetes bacterium]|nr:hypothetical protein [Planctomycetota bacterium]